MSKCPVLTNKVMLYALFISLSFFSAQPFSKELKLLWSIDNTFNMPESAAYDAKRDVVYVSNVNHYAKDNNGFISKVSADGKQVELKWLTGLHSPTGLTVNDDVLYAVDFDALVLIDLESEQILKRVPAVDASDTPVLNDVAISGENEVFVSGSRSRAIYKLMGDRLEVWFKDVKTLENANGLFVHDGVLFHGGQYWTAFDIKTKKTMPELSAIGTGLIDIDGITSNGKEGFIVSLIDDPRLWLVRKDQAPQPMTQDELRGIDMHYLPKQNRLYLPRVGGTLSAYQLVE